MLDDEYAEALAIYASGDYDTAQGKWRPLADQGHKDAQHNLGTIFHNGQGVTQDPYEAAKWYRKAADQGHLQAQFNLGLMYSTGDGVPQDYVLAHMWLNLAAAQGDKVAKENRDWYARKMTRAEVAEAQKLARKWIKKHQQ